MSASKLSKHSSRIAAVQIMYQIDIVGGDSDKVCDNLLNYYVKEEEMLANLNVNFLKKLIQHFDDKNIDFEAIIKPNLSKNSTLIGVSALSISIIKVAIIEMMFEQTDIPVIINEYVEIAKYFLNKKSVAFINAVLDKISKNIKRMHSCQLNK